MSVNSRYLPPFHNPIKLINNKKKFNYIWCVCVCFFFPYFCCMIHMHNHFIAYNTSFTFSDLVSKLGIGLDSMQKQTMMNRNQTNCKAKKNKSNSNTRNNNNIINIMLHVNAPILCPVNIFCVPRIFTLVNKVESLFKVNIHITHTRTHTLASIHMKCGIA